MRQVASEWIKRTRYRFAETSWEDAAKAAVAAVDKSVRDMRIAEVVKYGYAFGR
ncbi:hypothetical protein DSCA_20580 [Desulfosarcina alkanivorans]|jgi:hypothetical protein|uniref:Uncharacterized protein n=1 Tax=Desulfosarcina alkanivorans TaxID=571177 RepID=A0A5K7YGD2_9BACT|nr:hypothetical protein DSCA_20580 [Desulfosarcina alkanivorans]